MKNICYTELYEKIHILLGNTTPLKVDCGVLCGRRCCSGSDDKGMLLFPGETSALEVKESGGRRLAVCNGKCDRNTRPVSCMLFPFFPTVDKNGKIKVELDYRGVSVCPLISNSGSVAFDRKFLKNTLKAGKLLAKNEECRRSLEEITDEITQAKELYMKLCK